MALNCLEQRKVEQLVNAVVFLSRSTSVERHTVRKLYLALTFLMQLLLLVACLVQLFPGGDTPGSTTPCGDMPGLHSLLVVACLVQSLPVVTYLVQSLLVVTCLVQSLLVVTCLVQSLLVVACVVQSLLVVTCLVQLLLVVICLKPSLLVATCLTAITACCDMYDAVTAGGETDGLKLFSGGDVPSSITPCELPCDGDPMVQLLLVACRVELLFVVTCPMQLLLWLMEWYCVQTLHAGSTKQADLW